MNKLKCLIPQFLIDRYGSPRGVISTYWHKFLNLTGYYRKYSKIDWNSFDRLVFVCKGNICRSAYAEAIAKTVGVESISCGVSTKDDVPAYGDAIKTAESRGVNLKDHKTSRLTSITLKPTDLLIAMEPWHVDVLEDYFQEKCNQTLKEELQGRQNITLLGLWGGAKRPLLPDPYGRTDVYFNNCFEYIEKSVYEIEKKLKGH